MCKWKSAHKHKRTKYKRHASTLTQNTDKYELGEKLVGILLQDWAVSNNFIYHQFCNPDVLLLCLFNKHSYLTIFWQTFCYRSNTLYIAGESFSTGFILLYLSADLLNLFKYLYIHETHLKLISIWNGVYKKYEWTEFLPTFLYEFSQ
jgi:hypothetical protein